MKEVFIILGIFGALIVGINVGVNAYQNYRCDQFELVTEKPTRWVHFDTCYIQHKGEWVSYENYERMIIGRDGLLGEIEELDQ